MTTLRTVEYPYRLYVHYFFALAVVVLGVYIFFVNAIIMDVVGRERALQSLAEIQTEVTTLESAYLTLASTVTLDRATELGLVPVAGATDFAYRDSVPTAQVSFRR